MKRSARCLLGGLCGLVLAWAPGCGDRTAEPGPNGGVVEADAADTHNPFGLEDIVDCCGAEEQEFADGIAETLGAAEDENAEAWASTGAGSFESIDGEWQARWRFGENNWFSGTATIRTIGDRVYIHHREYAEYLIEARRSGDLLIGRYQNTSVEEDTTPWVGRIVGHDRIDGAYALGRWDFRRGGGSPAGGPAGG